MFDFDKWQEIFNTIEKNKLRSTLTALGVFWGIFMLILLLGAGKGMENGVLQMFGDQAVNSLYVWTQKTTKPYKGFSPGRRVQFTNDDIKALRDNFPEIKHVASRIHMGSLTFIKGNNTGAYEVRGELPDYIHIEPIDIREGRFFNPLDIKERRKIIVIGKAIKKVLFGDEEALGKYVKVGGIDYRITGIFKSKRKGERAMEDEQTAFIPLTTAQQIMNMPNRIHWFVCSMHDDIVVSDVEGELKALLRKRHSIHPEDKEGIGSFNLAKEFGQFTGLFAAIKLFVGFVGIMTLFAGIVGVGNVMLIIVKERTKEIGIRKAMGATPGSIISMILLESVFITTLSGYLGLLAGTGLLSLVSYALKEFDAESMFFANPEVDFSIGLLALTLLVFFGAIAGLIPALHAARINPVVALRDE